MNELVTVRAASNVEAYRASTDAAELCKAIVKQTAVSISGRRHVTVEGWQAIAIAHGCAASSDHVERVNDDAMGGFKAVGIVRRMSDGAEIARAEGFLGDDEQMWAKRPVYARRAMTQTRAISRACRSAFAHVVVMIDKGLSTIPAEEVEEGGFEDEVKKVPGISKIKKNLNALMLAGNKATDLEAFNALVHDAKDDLTAIKEGNHPYWTGDGEDSEGFKAWIVRRRAELAPVEESVTYQLLVSTLEQVGSTNELTAWLAKNGDVVETLDGEESRRFEEIYETTEAALKAVANVAAG
jgi:hypothetical protein